MASKNKISVTNVA